MRGIIELMETGVVAVQHDIIKDQADRLNTYESRLFIIEDVLRNLLNKPDTPQESKEMIRKAIQNFERGRE